MKFLFLILSFITIFLCANFQLLHKSDIDAQMSEQSEALIYKQSRISFVLTKFSTQIKNCCDKVKNFPEVLTSLENFDHLVKVLRTLDDHEVYVNISTCGDINKKITMIDFERNNLMKIIRNVNTNTSQMTRQNGELLVSYNKNFRAMSGEKCAFDVVQTFSEILKDFSDYVRVLLLGISKLTRFNGLLTFFKLNYCDCLKNVAWTGFNSTLETNLQIVENKLVENESKIRNLTLESSKNVEIAFNSISESTLKSNLNSIQTILKSLMSISSFKRISWPKVQNCNDFWTRFKFLLFKRSEYVEILSSASLNHSRISSILIRLNSTVESLNSTLTSAQRRMIRNAANSCASLRENFFVYIWQIIYSINRISRMMGDFVSFGDSHCSCDFDEASTTLTTTTRLKTTSTTKLLTTKTSTTTTQLTTTTSIKPTITTTTTEPTTTKTTTSTEPTTTTTTTSTEPTTITTTSEPTTTTTMIPCGVLKPYDIATSPKDPELFGFASGTYFDGSTIYPGTGNFSQCDGEDPGKIFN